MAAIWWEVRLSIIVRGTRMRLVAGECEFLNIKNLTNSVELKYILLTSSILLSNYYTLKTNWA